MTGPPPPSGRLAPAYPVETERLALRPLTAADAGDVLAYRSLPEVCRYVPFAPMTEAEIAEKLGGRWRETTISGAGDSMIVGVELTATGRVIGDLTLSTHSAEHRDGEIGWVLHPEHGGHGYATEAVRALLGLAFDELRLHRVAARLDARNGASARLAERLGMRREAHLIENEWFKGEWSDELQYAMLDREWRALAAG